MTDRTFTRLIVSLWLAVAVAFILIVVATWPS